LLIAYELSQKVYRAASPVLVKHEELEDFYASINSTLLSGCLSIFRGEIGVLETKIMKNLKHLTGRAGLTDWELRMLYGICSQVEKKIKESY
jgi:tRNA C32,U32 (ribose-2'-O)-methylase TrmJ